MNKQNFHINGLIDKVLLSHTVNLHIRIIELKRIIG